MHNYAHESKQKLGRNHSKERPQSERKAEIAESDPQSWRKAEIAESDRGQSGKQEATAFRTEISQYFAVEL